MTTKRKPLKAWQRLLISVDLNYSEIDAALEKANKHFQDTTGVVDGNGKLIIKPRISTGRKTSLKISVNSGLAEVAGILATATGKSRNKVMAILVSRCLYDALRDMRQEQQKLNRNQQALAQSTLNNEIPF